MTGIIWLLEDLKNMGVFDKAEESMLLTGKVAGAIANAYCMPNHRNWGSSLIGSLDVVFKDLEVIIRNGHEVKKVIDSIIRNQVEESVIELSPNEIDHLQDIYLKNGGKLYSFKLQKYYDTDFGAYYFKFTIGIKYTRNADSVNWFVKVIDRIKSENLIRKPGEFVAMGIDISTATDSSLLTKLNVTSAINVVLGEHNIKDLSVEIKNVSELYVFYRLYPKLDKLV